MIIDGADKSQKRIYLKITSHRAVPGLDPTQARWSPVSNWRNVAQFIARQITPFSKNDVIEKCVKPIFQ